MAEPKPRAQRRQSPPAARNSSAQRNRALTGDMTCEMALRAISRGCVEDLKRHGRAAARGDAEALHGMRIALTRLRTAIRFFAPAVDNVAWRALQQQASWLGRESGMARDIDVALQRERRKGAADRTAKPWREQRDRLYERLARALHSARYRQFIAALSRRTRLPGDDFSVADPDRSSAGGFSMRRLKRWRSKLLTKGRKLDRLGTEKLHRLRIRAKRFRYAMEWSVPLCKNERPALRKQIAQAKLVQNALGRLNDASAHQAMAEALGIDPLPSMVRLGRQKSQQRFLKNASRALDELEAALT